MYVVITAVSLLLSVSVYAFPLRRSNLDETRLQLALQRGAGILGQYSDCPETSKTCQWMVKFADDIQLVDMNIPGTHDAATWNYTQARQDELKIYTGDDIQPAPYFRCQQHSMFDMLNGGIRAFDFRIAYNPGNVEIGFHHGQAVLDPNATFEDVLYGFYYWLDNHPSEAVLISINHEGGTGTPEDEAFYQQVYDVLNNDLASDYWVQVNGILGTLGEARGKLTLLQRFSWKLLPPAYTKRFGIFLDPSKWTDNGANIELTYNTALNQTAYIEDFYETGLPKGTGTDLNVKAKLQATTAHLEKAIEEHSDQLFISFASGFSYNDAEPQTPIVMALGDGNVTGVNQRLLPWLTERKDGRLGIIMLDFFDNVPGLVEAIIGV